MPPIYILSFQTNIDLCFESPSFLKLLGLFFSLPHSLKIFLSLISPMKHSSAMCPFTEHLTWWPCLSSKSSLSREYLFHSTFPLVMLLITALFLQLSLMCQLSQASLDNVVKNYHWTMLSILTYFTKSNRNAW